MMSLSGLADQIEKSCLEGKNGMLMISDSQTNGKVFIVDGIVSGLQFEKKTGESALAAIEHISHWNYAIFIAGHKEKHSDATLPSTEQILRRLRAAPTSNSFAATQPSTHQAAESSSLLPEPSSLEGIIRAQLAQYIGPVANVIVKKQHDTIASLRSRKELELLLQEFAEKLHDPAAAQNFVKAVTERIKH